MTKGSDGNALQHAHRIIRFDLICPCMHLSALLRLAKSGPEAKDRLWRIACRGRRPLFNRQKHQGNGLADRAAGAQAGGEKALLRDRAGKREVQHDESEDVERRTELYTRGCWGRSAVEDGRCLFGEGVGR
ncbi:uncharacterized protein N7511_000553 [Penicillium nucicola]|uniref:uncharacterized protein n=1 Tax=Penicillium nucicola TaxID=1850975 RepID=UPI0025454E03|nr:uncharacterized protein N7511_000553 [Penicillium nucicola]KAJ5775542.1 hypothetical protein N7511_000553 [Penicillium nucicola]